MSDRDAGFMAEALKEARKGIGLTSPNPNVGAVLVKGDAIVGRGWHRKAGEAHAEVNALADCRARGIDPSGSEAFVTLEPCSTHGRTGACTDALAAAGVSRVVWSADDPNPSHAGRAREVLQGKGIETKSKVLEAEGRQLIRAFAKAQLTGLPWVVVKVGCSLDGRITRPPGEGQWLTSEASRKDVQNLRLRADAILTSGRTARADNPKLNYRGGNPLKQQPLRVVVSEFENASLPADCHLLSDELRDRTIITGGDLEVVLKSLVDRGCLTVLVESGGRLVAKLLEKELVDEWVAYFAPLVCAGPNAAVGGEGWPRLEDVSRLGEVSYERIGDDVRVSGILKKEL